MSLYLGLFLLLKKQSYLFGVSVALIVVSSADTVNAQAKKPSSRTVKATTVQNQYSYEIQRQNLVAKDSLKSFSTAVVLSKKEQAVNQKLIGLRKEMIRYYDSIQFFPPSRSFYKSAEHMYTTRLFSILKKLPKGGILHLHPSAGVSYRWLVEQALKEPNCYVYWQPDNGQHLKGQIHFFKDGEAPQGFYLIKRLYDSVPAFSKQLYKLLTFDETINMDSVDVWGEFENRFQRTGGFISYKPVFQKYLVAMFDSLVYDGVQHVELREHLGGSLYDLEHPPGTFQYDSIIHYTQHAVNKIRIKEPNFTATLIYTNIRFHPVEVIRHDFIKAFEVRKKYPHLVKGYDLVAHEDAGNTTEYYREVWLMRDSLSNVYGVDMPLYFHNGESNWHHVQNLYDAVLLKAPRIGHGFNLSFFPAAEEEVRRQNICMEVCPLSNQILGYIDDLRLHPANKWIRSGIQISISPDDPGLFGYAGVTPDYWAIFLAWELDLRDLKKLCMNSIEYSSLSKKEKEIAYAAWQKKWDGFVEDFALE